MQLEGIVFTESHTAKGNSLVKQERPRRGRRSARDSELASSHGSSWPRDSKFAGGPRSSARLLTRPGVSGPATGLA